MFTSVDGLARFSAFEAEAVSGSRSARPGEYLDLNGTAFINARVAAPPETRLVVLRNGEVLHEVVAGALGIDIGAQPGVYRIEVYLPAALSGPASVPWIVSNPFYVGLRTMHHREPDAAVPIASERTPLATAAWRAEASTGSESSLAQSVLSDGTPALEWRFALSAGGKQQQYAAMRFPLQLAEPRPDRLQLRATSDRPCRLWIQLRAPGGREGQRWGKTFYLDESLRMIELRLADLRPLESVSSARPPLDQVDSLLLVADTLNTRPGTSGAVKVTDLWLAR